MDVLLGKSGFVTADEVVGGGKGYSFPSASPDRRLDWILVSSGGRVSDLEYVESRLSDHLLTVAEIDCGSAGKR